MEPKYDPFFQKESPFAQADFQVPLLNFRGVNSGEFSGECEVVQVDTDVKVEFSPLMG